jgi:outer membrane protein assembly factor BamE
MPRQLLTIAALCLCLAACFKPEIRQGNFLEKDTIAVLKPGMTQAQVLAIMGRPMIQDPFHPERWDYVRWVNPNDGSPIENWRVTVFFQGSLVARIDAPPPQNAEGKLQLPTVEDLEPLPQTKQSDNGTPPTAPPRR